MCFLPIWALSTSLPLAEALKVPINKNGNIAFHSLHGIMHITCLAKHLIVTDRDFKIPWSHCYPLTPTPTLETLLTQDPRNKRKGRDLGKSTACLCSRMIAFRALSQGHQPFEGPPDSTKGKRMGCRPCTYEGVGVQPGQVLGAARVFCAECQHNLPGLRMARRGGAWGHADTARHWLLSLVPQLCTVGPPPAGSEVSKPQATSGQPLLLPASVLTRDSHSGSSGNSLTHRLFLLEGW